MDFAASAYAAPIGGGAGAGIRADEPATPASVMKIQIGLAAAHAIATGGLDGAEQRVLAPAGRTAGPAGISLLRDEVRMSVRDLLSQMLTISDNAATDELIALVGLDRINALTAGLDLTGTRIVADLRTMLDGMAVEAGFASYAAMAPADGLVERLDRTAALDPSRGSRTTAAETVQLLQAIWADTAADPAACAVVRAAMAQQLTRHRIASGFGPEVQVAAKSGALMGIVRNEAGVVTYPDGRQYAVAVFTRRPPGATTDPALIDACIGRIARTLIEGL